MKTKRTVLSVFGALALVVALSGCNMLSLRPAETAQIRVSAAQQMNAASGFFGTLRDVERIEVRILLDPSTDSTQTPVADMTELVKLILTGDNGWTAVADSVPTMTRLVFIAEAIGPAGPYIEGQLGFGADEMDIAIDGAPFNDPEEVVMFTGLTRTTINSGAARVAFTLRANQGGVAQVPRIESIQVSLNGIEANFQERVPTDYHIRVGFAPYDNAVMDPERWWYRIWDPQQNVRADQNEIGPNDTARHSRATGQFVVDSVPNGDLKVTFGTGQNAVTATIDMTGGSLSKEDVASRIASKINSRGDMPVTATRSGNRVILTAKVTGSAGEINFTADDSAAILSQDLGSSPGEATVLTRQGRRFSGNSKPGWFTASEKASFARPWGSTLVSNTGRASDNNEVFFKYLFPTPPNRFSDALGNPLPTVLVDGEYRLGTYNSSGGTQVASVENDGSKLTFKAYSETTEVNVVYTYTDSEGVPVAWNSPAATTVSVKKAEQSLDNNETFTTYNQFGRRLPTVTVEAQVPQWIVEDYQSNYWIEVMNPQHNMLRRAFIMNRGIENDSLRFAPAVSARMEADDTVTPGYVRFTAIDGNGEVFDTSATGASSYNRLVWIVLPNGNAVDNGSKRWMMYGNLTDRAGALSHQDVQDLLNSLDARFEDVPNAINVAAGILSGDTVGPGGLVTGIEPAKAIVSASKDIRTWTSGGANGGEWDSLDDPKDTGKAAVLEFNHARYFDSITAEGARIILLAFNEDFFQDSTTSNFIRRPFFYTSFDVSGSTFEFCEVLGDWGTCPGGE